MKQKPKALLLIPKAAQPPVSTAAQTPATTIPSNLPQTANTLATTTTTQSVATTTTTSNTQSTIAIIHQASEPEKEASPANPVPGLTDLGSEEQDAEQEAEVSPEQIIQRSIEDLFAAHSMSGLHLGDGSVSETDPKTENITSGGPGPSSDFPNPATQQPLSSTPTQPLPEPQNDLSVSATASSKQLASTIHAAHDSTTSMSGFDSASNIFHGEASSSIPAVQPTGPNLSESVTDPGEGQGSPHTEDNAMDTTNQDAYSQHTEEIQPVVQPEANNLPRTDADQAVRLMAQLFQAQQAGNVADLTSQLHGQQAQQLMQILQLAREVGQPTGAGQGNFSVRPDTGTDFEPDSTTQSGSDSESVHTDASEHHRRRLASRRRLAPAQAQQLLEESDRDVIVIDERIETEGLETVHLTTGWDKDFEREEASWPTRFPTRKPFY